MVCWPWTTNCSRSWVCILVLCLWQYTHDLRTILARLVHLHWYAHAAPYHLTRLVCRLSHPCQVYRKHLRWFVLFTSLFIVGASHFLGGCHHHVCRGLPLQLTIPRRQGGGSLGWLTLFRCVWPVCAYFPSLSAEINRLSGIRAASFPQQALGRGIGVLRSLTDVARRSRQQPSWAPLQD